MNEIDARAVPVLGGYHGEFRKVHRAAYEPVCVHGIPQVYPTSAEAEVAAWRAVRAHLCRDIVGSGYQANAARKEAEKVFGKILPGKGRRPVEVVRR